MDEVDKQELQKRQAAISKTALEFEQQALELWYTWAEFRENIADLAEYDLRPSQMWQNWVDEMQLVMDLVYAKHKQIQVCLESVEFRGEGEK